MLNTEVEKLQPKQRNLFISFKYTGNQHGTEVKSWPSEAKEELKSFLLDEVKFFT
jgi:hypothetical protein